MLKNITPNQDLTINTLITSENDSSDRDFFNKKLLDFTTNNVINNTINGEIYEYKPEIVTEINYNIFFLRYIQSSEVIELQNVIEKEFSEHYNKSVNDFKNKPVSSIYEIAQDNSLRDVDLPDIFRDKITSLNNSPYFIRDFVSELRLKNPNKNGIPIFYNSFGLPFYEKKDLWINDNLLFSNKPYFYNSFLLLEFYDTPSTLIQRRIHTIPIFINSRYNLFEKPLDRNFLQERPCFKLTNGVEGFSFFFLDNFYTNEFYVRFSFWDALSGIKRDLLPSSKQETNKKWLQDPTTFKQELRYLKYTLNYETKTYNIFEYNSNTNNYDLERTNFDLYELEFDEYYKNNIVLNDTPYNAKIESKPPQPESFNPLKFNIKNLVFDYTNTADYTRKEKLLIENYTNAQTFLGLMAPYLDSYQIFVINNKKGKEISISFPPFSRFTTQTNISEFTDFETKKIKIPLIPGEIDSASLTLSNFSATNIDDQSWRIRRITLEDINIINGTKNFKFNLYNEINSNISDKKKYKLAEAIFESSPIDGGRQILTSGIFRSTIPLSNLNSSIRPPFIFTEKLFDDFDIFEDLISVIESFFINYYKNDIVGAFIDELFNLLKLDKKYYEGIYTFPTPTTTPSSPTRNAQRIPQPKERTFRNYRDAIKPLSKPIDNVISYVNKGNIYELKLGSTKTVEFSIIKPALIKEYNDAKINDIELYERIKILSKNFMIQFYNQQESNRVTSGDGGIDLIRIPGTNITVNLPVEIPFSETISDIVSNIPVLSNIFSSFFGNQRDDTQEREQKKYDEFGNINKITLDRYFKKFNPLNHRELLGTYINLAKRQYINPYYYFGNNVYTRGEVNNELIRSYSLGVILLLNGDNSLTLNETLNFDLILNIGKFFKHELDLEADINITGKSRISLINNDNDIKNIIIPIDIVVKP